jgi:hypothetical protein
MTWEGLVDALRASGHAPEELDYMENYGAVAAGRHAALRGRHLRCVFGTLRIDGSLQFDVYVFPSADEAGEFSEIIGRTTIRRRNVVAEARPEDLDRVVTALEQL